MTTRLKSDAAEQFKNLADAITEFKSRKILQLVGNKIKDIIYKRTKSGFGVNDDSKFGESQRQKLKKLSKSYIAQREGKAFFFKRDGKIYKIDLPQQGFRPKQKSQGSFFGAKRSNLTYTGQLLESIRVRVYDSRVEVDIPPTSRDDGQTNAEVGKFVSRERPFFNLTEGELKIIDQLLKQELKKILKSKSKFKDSQLRGF